MSGDGVSMFVFSDWKRLVDLLGVTQKDLQKAAKASVRKTGRWANRECSRGLAKAANIPLSVMRAGNRIKLTYRASRVILWYGLNAISSEFLKPSKTSAGIRFRGATYKEGFFSDSLGRGRVVFQRVGKDRLPITRMDYEIETKAREFFAQFERGVAAKFTEFFFSELDSITGREPGDSYALTGPMK